MAKSTRRSRRDKPAKPRPDFPLFPHASGRWAKKVRGKFCYFGKVADDPKGEAALEKWLDEKDELLAGRTPSAGADVVTVADLCNHFLTAKKGLLVGGEITDRTFQRYYSTAELLVKSLGKNRPVNALVVRDFERLRERMAKRWGPVALTNELGIIRGILRYGFDSGLLDKPLRTGQSLRRPAARLARMSKAAKLRMFESAELRAILDKATPATRAMILLGVNCGLGNTDVAELPQAAVNLETGWLDFPRSKTGVGRHCPLWPETIDALKAALDARPDPKDLADKELVFLGRDGRSLVGGRRGHRVAGRIRRLLESAGVLRPGLNFYALRHSFATVGEETGDQVAVDAIMGHVPPRNDMRAVYRERLTDERLRRVVDHVHDWLFPPGREEAPATVPFRAKHG